MIAYLATREQFLKDAPTIAQKVFDLVVANLNLSVEHEKQAWANSVGGAMHHVVPRRSVQRRSARAPRSGCS